MSGGHFDYKEVGFKLIADKIENLIEKNFEKNEWGNAFDLSYDTLKKFQHTADLVRVVSEMVQKIDYLVSGDINETDYENWFNRITKVFPRWT